MQENAVLMFIYSTILKTLGTVFSIKHFPSNRIQLRAIKDKYVSENIISK